MELDALIGEICTRVQQRMQELEGGADGDKEAPKTCGASQDPAAAAEDKPALERTMDGLRGLTDCIPDAKVRGCIYGANAWQLGDIQGNPAMEEAYQLGKSI